MNLHSSFVILFFLLSCVLNNTNSQYRIIGGSAANILDSPHLVSINDNGGYACVGSLITFWHVVTAAHCLADSKAYEITVVAGVSDLREHQNRQTRNAMVIRIAPNFNPKTLDMDIAVIKVSEPFDECDTVKTIELCRSTLTPRRAMRVSGWGWTTPRNGAFSFILQSAVLYIIEKDECAARYARKGISLTESMICFFTQGAETCLGDSGAPDVASGQLCAVVLAGISLYSSPYPSTYTTINNETVRAFLNSAVRN